MSATVTTLNAFFADYHADGGASVDLGDGRILWLFGDTIPDTGAWDRNSAVIQAGGDFQRIPGTFVPHSLADHWYWPGAGKVEGGRLHLLMQDFLRTGTGAWDWRYDHTDVLTYSLPDLTLLTTAPLPARDSGAMWGQLVPAADGYTYVYGAYTVDGQWGKAAEVAKIPDGQLANPAAWQYLGTQIPTSLELGTVVSVVRTATGYRLFSKRLDMWSHEIISYDAADPTGPWTNRQVVATIPVPSGQWTYSVEAHPESGVLTYATNCENLCPEYHLTSLPMPLP